MTTHPFVATPNNGPCSSCGRKRYDPVHKMGQAQNSTAEQLNKLKTFALIWGYELDNIHESDALDLIKMANSYGLYDAADLVRTRMENGQLQNILDY